MANYFLRVTKVSRGKGARVTRAAAYRAGERIHDERSSDVFDFSDREDVAHKEIILPTELADSEEMEWARDRGTLWNAAEHAGRRRNSLLAREVLVFLPVELTPAQRVKLVQGFSQDLSDRYRGAVDITVHKPRPGADPRHHHAHLLMTTRVVSPDGFGARTALELSGTERRARGLGPSKADYLAIRERWAQVTNDAFRAAGVKARIDHRSLKDQGIDREPVAAIPQKVYYSEKKSGLNSDAGDEIRARHRERAEARTKGEGEFNAVQERHREEDRLRARNGTKQKSGGLASAPRSALSREELNAKRRERHRANAEKLNSGRREQYKAKGESLRQKYREWRAENADQVNEKRAQWRAANADEVNRKARERRAAHVAADSMQELAREKRVLRSEEAAQKSAQAQSNDSATQAVSDADEFVAHARKWWAERQTSENAEASRDGDREKPSDHSRSAQDDDDDDEDEKERTKSRTRDYDTGL